MIADGVRRGVRGDDEFLPTDIIGIKLWLDASQLSLNNDDAVSEFTDFSGENSHATQGTPASRPTYKTSGLNSKPVVRFDGSDDFMVWASSTGVFNYLHNGTGVTVFIVLVPDNTTRRTLFDNNNGSAAGDSSGMNFEYNRSSNYSIFISRGVATTAASDSNTTAFSTAHRLLAIRHGSSQTNDFQFYVDNVQEVNIDYALSLSSANATYNLTLGKRASTNDRYFKGDIAEVIFYNSVLSSDDFTDVTNYLNAKWGLGL